MFAKEKQEASRRSGPFRDLIDTPSPIVGECLTHNRDGIARGPYRCRLREVQYPRKPNRQGNTVVVTIT